MRTTSLAAACLSVGMSVGLSAGLLALGAGTAWAQNGLSWRADAERDPWPRWHTRVSVGPGAGTGALDLGTRNPWATRSPAAAAAGAAPALPTLRLYRDYYFSGPVGFGESRGGGFRATGGLLLGSRAAALGAANAPDGALRRAGEAGSDPSQALPYVGVGYTELSVGGGWRFSADLGLMASPSGPGLRPGRLGSGQSLDEIVREMRMRPVLQLGVSYAF